LTQAAVTATKAQPDRAHQRITQRPPRLALEIAHMQRTAAARAAQRLDRGGPILINAQQEFEKRRILQNALAHNGGVSWSSQT